MTRLYPENVPVRWTFAPTLMQSQQNVLTVRMWRWWPQPPTRLPQQTNQCSRTMKTATRLPTRWSKPSACLWGRPWPTSSSCWASCSTARRGATPRDCRRARTERSPRWSVSMVGLMGTRNAFVTSHFHICWRIVKRSKEMCHHLVVGSGITLNLADIWFATDWGFLKVHCS